MKVLVVEDNGTETLKELDNHWPMVREELGGWIEQVRINTRLDVVMLVDEEGLVKRLPMNSKAMRHYTGIIAGKAIFVGLSGSHMPEEEWTDLPEDFKL